MLLRGVCGKIYLENISRRHIAVVQETNKKGIKIAAIVVLIITLAYSVLALLPRKINYTSENVMLKDGDLPILIAHGGGNGEFPDNTLEAFYNAFSACQDVIMETDVCVTKDNLVILSHDTTLDRRTNATGAIANHTYDSLIANKVNFGYTNNCDESGNRVGELIPFTNENGKMVTPLDVEYPVGVTQRDEKIFLATKLEELLVAFPNNRMIIEIKQSGELGIRCLYEVRRLIKEHGAFDRVTIGSFHDEVTNELYRLYSSGEVPDGFMFSPNARGVIKFYSLHLTGLDVFYNDPICAMQIPSEQYGVRLATAELVTAAHRHGIAVHFWTINDRAEMEYLIDIGADGIITDYPHRLKEVLDSRTRR